MDMGNIVVGFAGENSVGHLPGRRVVNGQPGGLAPYASKEKRPPLAWSNREGLLVITVALPFIPPVGSDQAALVRERVGEQLLV